MKRWVVADPGGKVKEDSEAGFQEEAGSRRDIYRRVKNLK